MGCKILALAAIFIPAAPQLQYCFLCSYVAYEGFLVPSISEKSAGVLSQVCLSSFLKELMNSARHGGYLVILYGIQGSSAGFMAS